MVAYGQFCPVSKAAEVVGDRWTMLILRELLMGTHRFNDFQRALSRISPTILAKRLKYLEACGVVRRRRVSGQKGYDYQLTASGKELEPMIETLAVWGMRWARGQMSDDELDVELLMWDIHRRIDTARLPAGETVLCFTFEDLDKYKSWWLVIEGDDVDLCTEDPGKDVDLYVTTKLRTLVEVWQGDTPLAAAIDAERITAIGDQRLKRDMASWFPLCAYADVPRPKVKRA
ncbi:MAG: helix-turn-helix transcriptional regulator [Alphaproteobacteria bacterium]|nr:helix-turn-helix transcriptional regulator [Alphaproteobacteria bacterium]